jgi:hypothetical protein
MQNNFGFGQNPYVQQQAAALQTQSNQNLSQNVMPGIGQGAQAAGQYGSSRQGIAEGVAAGNAQAGVAGAQANLYANAYATDQNAALSNKSLDNNFYLGNQGQMQNFYSQQRGQDQSGMALGANLYNMGNSGNLAAGAGQTSLGQQYQNAPLSALQQYGNTLSPFSGLGGGQTTTATSGGGAQGMAGGALAGAQIAQNFGFGGGNSGGMAMTNGGGFTNTPNYLITS